MLKLTYDDSKVQAGLDAIAKGVDPRSERVENFLMEIGQHKKITINAQTRRGKDYKGKPFKPYNKAYARFKQTLRHGRYTGRVNLRLHDHMMNSLGVELQRGKGQVIVAAGMKKADSFQAKKMDWHVHGKGRLPIRDPMGYTSKEVKLYTGMAIKFIEELLTDAY